MSLALDKLPGRPAPNGPVVCVVLDGVGVGAGDECDAVASARMPAFHGLKTRGLYRTLLAHGTSVGLPSDSDMGNSEVGHNAMGAGRVYEQGALRVNQAIASGELFTGPIWRETMQSCASGGALHFLGLVSDGNVHSHVDHLIAMLRRAAKDGAKRLFVHALIDGRDVPSDSALIYIDQLESVLAEINQSGVTAKIASGGGRMQITMDRYGADWEMVARGWKTHVHGDERRFPSARAAIETFRREDPNTDDQNLPPFVIEEDGSAVGAMQDGDAVICFNFRGDRAMEISRAFEAANDFSEFDRGRVPRVSFAGMMEYDGDTHVPARYLVEPPSIERTMGEHLVASGVSLLALSETQKFGHVTYFWNGNNSGAFDDKLETYVEIPSDRAPFEQRPWMKAAEITDRLLTELRSGRHQFARVNYANGDMVGHTGSMFATTLAMEAMDLCLGRLVKAVAELGGILLVTADHGNAEEMCQRHPDGSVVRNRETGAVVVKTSHTINPVPFVLYDPSHKKRFELTSDLPQAGIASVAATCIELLGYRAPTDMAPALVRGR